jgi:diguanylate cyclase (GGDEF)-like protein
LEGRNYLISLLLKNIVQKENFYVQSHTSLRNLIDLMNRNQKGVVVVLEDKRPVGILTERDVVEILYRGISLDERVDTYAKKKLVMTRGDRTIGYALNLTIENNIRRVIVVDESDNFLGIITQQDLLKYLEEDFYRSTIKVKHILEKLGYLISVSPDDSLKDVLQKMVENRISAVSVIKDEMPVGIITEKDILKLVSREVSLEEKVSRYMSYPPITAGLDTTLVDVVKIMNERDIRRVIIVNNEGLAVNMLTIRDVLRNLEGDYNKFLERKLKSAKDILNLLPEMLIEVTDTGKEQIIIWANEKVLSKFGKEIIDKPVTDFIPQESWEKVQENIRKLNKIENIKLKKGNEIYELSGFFIPTEGKIERGRYQLIIRDITEDVQLSTTDPLTTIYNRRFINEFLMKEIERSKRSKKHFSIVICDIDNFKAINDTYGHLSGDIVLKTFSQLLSNNIRNLDVVGRYGGDEFVIILPEATNEIARNVIERLKLKIEGMEIEVPKEDRVKITASFGISTFPEDGISSDDLLVVSDERLYKAKSWGKNKVVFH